MICIMFIFRVYLTVSICQAKQAKVILFSTLNKALRYEHLLSRSSSQMFLLSTVLEEDSLHFKFEHNSVKYLPDPVCLCQQSFHTIRRLFKSDRNLLKTSYHWVHISKRQVTHPSYTRHKIIILPRSRSMIKKHC